MDQQTLAALTGVVISLLFSYVPGLSTWYDALDGTKKRLVMLGVLLIVAAGAFGASCAGIAQYAACDTSGAKQMLDAFIAAAVANQVTHKFTPDNKPSDGAQG
jgi:uncharacterized membrane protein